MKRNLSSQAIRAMAICMAVTLRSATAVSGVVTGTVVNVYAATNIVENVTNPGTDFSSLATGHFIATSDGLLFKVKNEGSKAGSGASNDNGTVTLVGTVTSAIGSYQADGTNVPYKAEVKENKVVIETSDYNQGSAGSQCKFEIEEIGDGTNPLAVATISNNSVPNFDSYNTPSTINGDLISGSTINSDDTNGLTIKDNAFKGVTINGDLDFSSSNLKDISEKAFYGTTVNGNLTLKGEISAPVKYEGGVIKETKKVFTNLTVTGDLNLSELNIKISTDNAYPNKGGLSILGLGFREGNDKTEEGEKGVKVEGKLILPENLVLDNYAFRNIEVEELDLTNTKLKSPGNENKDYIIANSFAFSRIGTLKFNEKAKQVGGGAFKGAHLDLGKVDFSKIERIAFQNLILQGM